MPRDAHGAFADRADRPARSERGIRGDDIALDSDKKGKGSKKASRSDERGAICVSEPERWLDDKELKFCIEFSVGDNATAAYQRAYKCGYNTANAQGYKLLSDIVIRKTIDRMRTERNERLNINADDVLRKIKLLSEYDAGDFYDDDGRLKPLSELHPDLRFVIEGMDVSEKVTGEEGDGISRLMKIKLPKKKDALELLAKHLQLLGDKPKANDADDSEELRALSEAMARTQTSTHNGQPAQ